MRPNEETIDEEIVQQQDNKCPCCGMNMQNSKMVNVYYVDIKANIYSLPHNLRAYTYNKNTDEHGVIKENQVNVEIMEDMVRFCILLDSVHQVKENKLYLLQASTSRVYTLSLKQGPKIHPIDYTVLRMMSGMSSAGSK